MGAQMHRTTGKLGGKLDEEFVAGLLERMVLALGILLQDLAEFVC